MAPTYPQVEDGIEIRLAQKEDRERVWNLLYKFFCREEPLAAGSEPKDEFYFDKDFLMYNFDHGISLIAVIKDTDELVGVTITGPKGPDEAEHLAKAAAAEGNTKWGRILKFLEKVEREADVFKRYNVTKVLHLHATCVDDKMRGKNICARLNNAVVVLARQMGFELLTTDCTSFYSASVKDRLGWDCDCGC
ncbi:arylalkylamine N-acetyltransferase-like 2 [Musca autumnalis]|uniref:arylalkylamine N-acetyltransferase-like 2 n=1 Tax=Musca autumnalis TaxID=221902 RepID=UPI003CF3DAF1